MTKKDLYEFEKEFGFRLLPTSFKKPLSEITKEEYRERIEYLYYVAQATKKIHDLEEKIEQYKQYILGRNCRMLCVDNYSLEYYLNINSWDYGMYCKDELLKLGITKQEMDEFISNEYKKLVKEKRR